MRVGARPEAPSLDSLRIATRCCSDTINLRSPREVPHNSVDVQLTVHKMQMPEARPPVPAWLERKLKVEAGHRCAIPTCRQAPVELAHIEPWSKVKEHTFENMIALCPTCHTRFDARQIDRKSMRLYKANLTIINSRYGDLEKRIIELFARYPDAKGIDIPGSFHILLMYLIEDGLIAAARGGSSISVSAGDSNGGIILTPVRYILTPKGREFVTRWANAISELD